MGYTLDERRGDGLGDQDDKVTLTQLEGKLRGCRVEDVLFAGFLDEEEVPTRFRALQDVVYFKCQLFMLTLEAIDSAGRLRVSLTERVRSDPRLVDENLAPAVMSVGDQVLDDSSGRNELVAIHLWGAMELPEELQCHAFQLDVSNGQQIFVDPTYHFGLRLGGPTLRQLWRDNWPGAAQRQDRLLSLR